MKLEEIKEIARDRGVKVSRQKKAELIRLIQGMEANPQCFETGQSTSCGQNACLWREDCK